MQKIWVLTCMMIRDDKIERHRTWGWFDNIEDAEACVFANAGDMYEMGYYNAAVLEETASGPCAYTTSELWYSAKYTPVEGTIGTYEVKRARKPQCLRGGCNFGMG